MAKISIENIRKSYGDNVVVKQMSLEIDDGEFLVLLGPSGCGKSTVLRMLAGLETITYGKMLIEDRVVNDLEPAERDIAFVFQNYALYPHMTVRQNIAFCLENQGMDRRAIAERVQEAAELVRLADMLERLPGQLSGGQRQRVAIARAVVRRPKVLLMDEPLSNLDAKLRGAMRADIIRVQEEIGATTVYVTHDQVEAMTMANRIVIMHDGIIAQIGAPMDVYQRPVSRFVASFIGSPAMNFVDVSVGGPDGADATVRTLHADGVSVALDDDAARRLQPYAGERVVLGFRPQNVAVVAPGKGAAMFEGRVETVEPYGPETYIRVALGDTVVSGRVGPDDPVVKGEPLGLNADPASLYFFDPANGAVIR